MRSPSVEVAQWRPKWQDAAAIGVQAHATRAGDSRAARARHDPRCRAGATAAEGVRQGLLDQRWGSKLGQMVLRSEITETMMQAGERWAELTRQYQRLFPGLPRATTALLERAIGRKLEIDPDDERAVRRAVSIERAYVRAAAAISTLHRAPAVFRSLMRLCVLDELLGDFQARLDAISGLRVLELHFCLTRE